jgi:hypothetical protein
LGEASIEVPWLGLIRLYVRDGLPENTPENSKSGLTALFVVLIIWPVVFDVTYNVLRRKGWDPWAPFKNLFDRKKD